MIQPHPDFILIVDDNPDNLSVLSQTLKGAGYAIRVAVDGEDALDQIERAVPVLILLDVMMPGIDGFETCRRIKKNAKTQAVPIIFMTALSDDNNKVKGLSFGAVDYVTKPFNEAEVLARVQIHLKITNLLHTLQMQNQRLNQEIEQRQSAQQALKQLNDELETRVESRTAQLNQSLADLQNAQVELVQQEKLSSLGELVAGVAHEINNPMGCIANNIPFVNDYSAQLIKHIFLYQQECPAPSAAILSHAQEIELDYLREDLPALIESMVVSSDRILAISNSLRTFARRDTQQKSDFSLHEGLDSTLLILKHRLKEQDSRAEIEIVKAYDELPLVPCYPGQMNQVFMNILANAIDAFDERLSEQPVMHPVISIRTQRQAQQVLIWIADNAGGMTEKVRSQIFEQAYTTKAVGKGTGLGLSIAQQIVVEKHGGELSCASTLGQGSEFRIELPV
jgi:signal transduction histidine kinase